MSARPRPRPAARRRWVAALLVALCWPGRVPADDALPDAAAAGDAAPAVAEDPPPPPADAGAEPAATRLVWRWAWDRGVRYRLELPFEEYWIGPDTGPLSGRPLEKRLAFIGSIGARIQVDAAGYGATRGLGHVDPGVELRRLRLGTRGEFYLVKGVSYALDLDVIGTSVEVADAYLWWRDVPFLRRFKVGNFTPPQSLESLTSARDIPFMETALPVEALGPARSSGIEIGGPVLDERVTWALAFVRTIGTTDQGDRSKDGGRVAARVTWLPRDDRAARRLTHVGASASVLFAPEDVRYQTRPESHLAPFLVDTGPLRAADQSSVFGLELLRLDGPWLVMGEALAAAVTGDGTASFWGMYGLAMRTLTGESQPYDRTSGVLGRFVPARPFSWRERTYGALRIGGRVSHLDLADGAVAGGRETDLAANLTWVLNRHLLLKLEYGLAMVRGRPDAGNLHVVQTRLQLDFY